MSQMETAKGLTLMGELVEWQGRDWRETWGDIKKNYPEIADLILSDREEALDTLALNRMRGWANERQPDGLPNAVKLDMPLLTAQGEITRPENHDPRELDAFGCKQMVHKLMTRRANLDSDIRFYSERYKNLTGEQIILPYPDESHRSTRKHRVPRPTATV